MDIQEHPFFEDIDENRIRPLVDASEVESLTEGSLIFDEGDASECLYLVLQGRIVFKKRLPSGERLSVSFCEEGGFFGEIGVLTREPRSLRAEAAGDAVVLRIPGSAIVDYLSTVSGPIESLLQSVIRHLHETTSQYINDMLHREKMSVVGSMMQTIVHDFRNPFCLISLSAQLLRQKHPDDETFRLCQNIERQVDRMVEMAGELSEFCRGHQTLNRERLNLQEVVNDFRDQNFPFFDNEQIPVLLDVPKADIMGDRTKLFRVLQNLITNAIDAIGDKPGQIHITGTLIPDYQRVRLSVADTGGGIPEEIRDRFFEPFVTHGKPRGTGLGSAIVLAIVEAHGGTIRFETETGKGTTFHIELPLA